eukprot:2762269-Prymnesium_polylepis.2
MQKQDAAGQGRAADVAAGAARGGAAPRAAERRKRPTVCAQRVAVGGLWTRCGCARVFRARGASRRPAIISPRSCATCNLPHAWSGERHARQSQGLGPVSYTHLTLPTICSV